jgi:sugar/nucleoside kinase (ribokinase family)
MLDILCIGDALVDIFLEIPNDNPHFGLDKDKNKLFIDYGYKISLQNYVKEIGGNACNTSVGIARLGKNVGLCAEIGEDEFSTFIINNLNSENINTSLLTQNLNKKTSFSVCLNYLGERTLLVEHVERQHLFNFENSSAKFIYLTSLGDKWENAYEKTLDFVRQTESKLAFNPGTFQLNNINDLVMELIQVSDFLFLNKQEAQKVLYGKNVNLNTEQEDIKKILFGLKSLGPKNVIITDSSNGSYLYSESGEIYHLGIIKVEVVEKTGAGDGYNAGFLSAILSDLDLKTAMIWGAVNSAHVVQKTGAQVGLLTKDVLEDKIRSLGNLAPQII